MFSNKKKAPSERKKKVRVCYYLPKEIRDFVKDRAMVDGLSRSCFVSSYLRDLKDERVSDE